jgi:hypothetical protein
MTFDEVETATEVPDSAVFFAHAMTAVFIMRKSETGHSPRRETFDENGFADNGDHFSGRSCDASRR